MEKAINLTPLLTNEPPRYLGGMILKRCWQRLWRY